MTKEEILEKNVGSLNLYWPGQSNGAVEATPGVLKAMDEYAESKSIAFAEWIADNTWENYADGVRIWRMKYSNEPVNTQRLYSLYKQSIAQ